MTDYEEQDSARTTPTEIEAAKEAILQAGETIDYIDLRDIPGMASTALHLALAELVREGDIQGLDPYRDPVNGLDDLIYRRTAQRVRAC
jgi:hypothetical protein